MPHLHTALCDLLEIQHPIVNAPMTPQAGGALAAAVSDAGAFAMIGFDEDESVESLREQVDIARSRPGRQFGVGLVAWVLERRPELLDLAIDVRPRMVSISFGDPSPYVERFRRHGILVASQVQSHKWARTALDAGVDVVVAQGTEAGGHTGSVGTLPLLQIVLAMTEKPVLAAGGIACGRGLAAVLAAGAAGAWIGTPFLLARESRTPQAARDKILASDETQTVLTGLYDRIQNKGFAAEFPGRAIRNAFFERWGDRADEMMRTPAALEAFREGKRAGDYDTANLYAGQSVGVLNRIRSARKIVEEIAAEAAGCIERASALLTRD
jgi:nitronate monooxygenase